MFLKLLVGIYILHEIIRYLSTVNLKYDHKTKESMDLDCEQLKAKFQNKNLCQFEPIEYWRQAVSNLSKTKIAFILIK